MAVEEPLSDLMLAVELKEARLLGVATEDTADSVGIVASSSRKVGSRIKGFTPCTAPEPARKKLLG